MGVIYSVAPVDDELREYLDEIEVEYIDSQIPPRNPSPNEILSILREMESVNFESGFTNGIWQAAIDSESDEAWTTIHLFDCNKLDEAGQLSFEKGEPKPIVQILKLLSEIVGNLALIPDTGDDPLIISPNLNVDSAISKWEHTAELDADDSW